MRSPPSTRLSAIDSSSDHHLIAADQAVNAWSAMDARSLIMIGGGNKIPICKIISATR